MSAISATIRAIKGRSSTAIIARGLPNVCIITTLIAKYADDVKNAPRVPTLWLNVELAAGGMYTVAKFAKDYGSLAFNIEDAIIVSLDVAM